jgi:3-hydroxypropanoate dehydrogenase
MTSTTDLPLQQAQDAVRQVRERIRALDANGLDLLFREARTHNGWLDREVTDDELKAAFDLMKMGPTSANCSPARIVFLRSPEAKEKLRPALSSGNLAKTMAAPVVALFAYDLKFNEKMDFLFPHQKGAGAWFTSSEALALETAFRNGTLQAAYFMIAARAIGLDCGPMSGFKDNLVNEAFFAGTSLKCNFICNLGHGDPASVFVRSPRLAFEEACEIL